MKETLWPIIWQVVTLAFFLLTTYATMWVKANAPTRAEFNSLREALQNLHDDFLKRSSHGEILDDHEDRLRKLEGVVRSK